MVYMCIVMVWHKYEIHGHAMLKQVIGIFRIGSVFPEKEKRERFPNFETQIPIPVTLTLTHFNSLLVLLLLWCQFESRIEAKRRSEWVREKMVSYVNILLYGVGGLVVAGMALLVAFQEKLVYVPVLPGLTKSYAINPSRLRLTYEDIWLRSSDGVRLHAWFIKLFPDCRGPRHSLLTDFILYPTSTDYFAVTVTLMLSYKFNWFISVWLEWEKRRSQRKYENCLLWIGWSWIIFILNVDPIVCAPSRFCLSRVVLWLEQLLSFSFVEFFYSRAVPTCVVLVKSRKNVRMLSGI